MTVADAERLLARLRPARARIDLDRLAANYHAIAAHAGRPVMPVVKADAYGHGAAPVARAPTWPGAWWWKARRCWPSPIPKRARCCARLA